MNAPAKIHSLSPQSWAENHRDYLMNFALGKTRNSSIAEDMVQETFLAAWKAREKFAGKATERTWLTRILLNKIADFYRSAARKPSIPQSQLESESGTGESALDAINYAQNNDNQPQNSPAMVAEHHEFLELLDDALEELPEQAASAFRMRELQGLSTKDITKKLKISPNHLWVLIHRAKKALRERLEAIWDTGAGPFSGFVPAH
ncbi:MAG: RNA polymerase sigma-70 factor (TIGR02943 family) [Verrucomicrobiales bacterium]|jgi:RNA polymerase sigma-70 factor (TIGR02943 family)